MKTNTPPNNDELERAIAHGKASLSSTIYTDDYKLIEEAALKVLVSAAQRCQQVEKERDEFKSSSESWAKSAGGFAADADNNQQKIDQLKSKVEELERERDDIHTTASMIKKERDELDALRHDLIKQRYSLQHQLSQYKAALEMCAGELDQMGNRILAWKQEAIDATDLKYGQNPQGEPINYWRGRRAALCELAAFLSDKALSLVRQVLKEAK